MTSLLRAQWIRFLNWAPFICADPYKNFRRKTHWSLYHWGWGFLLPNDQSPYAEFIAHNWLGPYALAGGVGLTKCPNDIWVVRMNGKWLAEPILLRLDVEE